MNFCCGAKFNSPRKVLITFIHPQIEYRLVTKAHASEGQLASNQLNSKSRFYTFQSNEKKMKTSAAPTRAAISISTFAPRQRFIRNTHTQHSPKGQLNLDPSPADASAYLFFISPPPKAANCSRSPRPQTK
jgi:hypothetical protein